MVQFRPRGLFIVLIRYSFNAFRSFLGQISEETHLIVSSWYPWKIWTINWYLFLYLTSNYVHPCYMVYEPLYCFRLSDLKSDQTLFEESGLISSSKLDGHSLFPPLDWIVFSILKMPDFKQKMSLPISESSTNWGFCCLCGLQWPSSFTFSMNIFTEPSLWHFSFPSKIHLYFANYFEFGFLTLSQFLKSLASKNDLIKKNLELQESWSKLPARLNSNSFWPPSWGTLGSRTLKTLVEFKIYLLQRFLVICS